MKEDSLKSSLAEDVIPEEITISLADGWCAVVSDRGRDGKGFLGSDWLDAIADVDALSEDAETVLKSHGKTSVVVKELLVGGRKISVVIKTENNDADLVNAIKSFRPAKSLRNFRTAAMLQGKGVAVAFPFAALWQKKNSCIVKSIYISEYIENSCNLFDFFYKSASYDAGRFDRQKREITVQIAEMLAKLHNNNLWHRDSKSGNFVVERFEDGGVRLVMVDMDGLKRYFLRRRDCQSRTLYKLGSTLLFHGSIGVKDYFRTFKIYCGLVGIAADKQNQLFLRLSRLAVGLQILTLAKSAIKYKDSRP